MNWKIERDPFLGPLAARWGEGAAWEAGFFEDDDTTDAPLDDVDWLCTPMAHVADGLGTAGAADPSAVPVVLLATGGFWPPHGGHLAMMERAREAVSAAGGVVVGGYLSPGHDQYLRLKWGGAAPPAAERLMMVQQAIDDRDWLAVDPWEALHRRVSVNYTDVVARLGTYLRHHVDPRLEVAFVCGGDNARFSLAFAQSGRCVVVGRPGSSAEVEKWRSDPRVGRDGRVIWIDGGHPEASSSLDPTAWSGAAVPSLRLRGEDERAVEPLRLAPERWDAFRSGLTARLSRDRQVEVVESAGQVLDVAGRVISLDPMTRGDVDLGVSREFDLGGFRRRGHTGRPGWPPLEDQLAAIPAGEYVVVDDDSVTGSTLHFVVRSLPPDVAVLGTHTLMEPTDGEIADARDFLIGSREGGLVIRLPSGAVGRVPYLLPYVDPHARCGVPAADVIAFSADMWMLNADAFAGTGLTVGDLPEGVGRVLAAIGRSPHESVEQLCRWHADRLDGYDRRG